MESASLVHYLKKRRVKHEEACSALAGDDRRTAAPVVIPGVGPGESYHQAGSRWWAGFRDELVVHAAEALGRRAIKGAGRDPGLSQRPPRQGRGGDLTYYSGQAPY